MRSGFPIHIVDVFAQNQYTGNQLAVVRESALLTDEEMRRIAGEMGYLETTFVPSSSPTDGGFDVRIFTPETELPFAGHPVLGTAAVLRRTILDVQSQRIVLNLDAGQIPVTVEQQDRNDVFWMEVPSPTFHETLDSEVAADLLDIKQDAIDAKYPPQVTSTGTRQLIIPLETLDVVSRCVIDSETYSERIVDALEVETVLVFAPETYEEQHDINARVFAPAHGVPEDPATGSANSCLAGYLVAKRYFDGTDIDIAVEQGYEIERNATLWLQASETEDSIEIRVGGRVIPVLYGELR